MLLATTMKNRTKYYLLLAGFVVCFMLGMLHEQLYLVSGEKPLPIEKFQTELNEKEHRADSVLHVLARSAEQGTWPQGDLDGEFVSGITYYVFDGEKMLYWSDNLVETSSLDIAELTTEGERFCKASNAYGVVKCEHHGRYTVTAFIAVKYRFVLNGDDKNIGNRFDDAFDMDNRVLTIDDERITTGAVYADDGSYLFSLVKSEPTDRIPLKYGSFLLYMIAYLLFLCLFMKLHWLFGEAFWTWRNYIIATGIWAGITYLLLHFNRPALVFTADLFSPIYYASNLMPSLGHLTIVSLLLVAISLVYYYKLRTPVYRHATAKARAHFALGQLFSVAWALAIDFLLHDLVDNSSFDLVFVSFEQVSVYSILAASLVFAWIFSYVMLRDKLMFSFKYALPLWEIIISDVAFCALACVAAGFLWHTTFHWEMIGYFVICLAVDLLRHRVSRFYRFGHLQIMTLICCFFVLSDVYVHTLELKRVKYTMIAENLAASAKEDYDIYTKTLLEEVDKELTNDEELAALMAQHPVSMSNLLNYLNHTDLHNYWNDGVNFTMNVFTTDLKLPSARRYDKQIADRTLQPYTEHFYINRLKSDSYQFVGIFDFPCNDGCVSRLFVVFYRLSDISESEFFFRLQTNVSLMLSAAVYSHGEKVLNSGVFVYPNQLDEVPISGEDVIFWQRLAHHVFYFDDDTCVIIGERHPALWRAFLIYWTYLFVFYFVLVSIAYITRVFVTQHYHLKNTFVAHIQRTFALLSVLFMVTALVASSAFIYTRYRNDQFKQIEDKTRYVQSQIQPYIQQSGASPESVGELVFLLQDLAKLYRADMHVYNSEGELIATSRPYLFTSGLCGRRINPQVFFKSFDQIEVLEEKIGRLDYLASYDVVRDGNGKILAYICVPMFFSSYALWRDLFFYLALLFNLYLIVLFLAAMVAYLVGRRLTKPLATLGGRLRQIRVEEGHANEKISYDGASSDEFGLLVDEYNHMVDELEANAQQLAASERELAWRDMARQIAHEIKNPLTPMKLTIQQLQRAKEVGGERFDDYFAKASRTLIEQIDSLSFIASEFSNFARMPMAKLTRVDLHAKLRAEVDLFRNNHEEIEIGYSSTVDEAYIMADSEQMTRLFNNLLKNAMQAIPSTRKGKIDVVLTEENGRAVVSVTDNGCGISDEVAEHIFVPNFTTKSSGMGLGLCICKNIVAVSSGEISFTTKVDQGTTFVVKFPLVD